jgi:1,4-alpha-glucan branching enzyme
VKRLVGDLNRLVCSQPALHSADHEPSGFRWIDANDTQQSVLSFLRMHSGGAPEDAQEVTAGAKGGGYVVCVGNFTPVPRYGYRVGVPRQCRHLEILNTDARSYGGSGMGNLGGVEAEPVPAHGYRQSLQLTLPPLSVLWLTPQDVELG